jgi:protein SCO1
MVPRIPFARLAAALAGAAALASCAGGSTPGPNGGSTPTPWAGAVLVNPLPKPAFTLTTDTGQTYDFKKETAGKVALLYFGYTHCPDACPTTMASLALALRQLPASVRSQVVTVFVTTDPQRDTPDQLRTWLAQYDPSFIGLTGTIDAINAAQDISALPVATVDPVPGASPGSYGVDHAAVVLVFSPDGYAHVEWPEGVATADAARDLQRLATSGFSGA